MARVFVGNLDPRVSEVEIEDDFKFYGVLRSVWVARRPPGYAFIEFDDRRDAMDAIRGLDGKKGWRVELSHNSKDGGGRGRGGRDGGGRGGGRGGGDDLKCYECGESGHFARECRSRGGGGRGFTGGRRRSPSPRRGSPGPRRGSPGPRRGSPIPRRRRSPSYGRRSPSPLKRSPPRRRSISPRRGRSLSRSPPYRPARRDSPYASGD